MLRKFTTYFATVLLCTWKARFVGAFFQPFAMAESSKVFSISLKNSPRNNGEGSPDENELPDSEFSFLDETDDSNWDYGLLSRQHDDDDRVLLPDEKNSDRNFAFFAFGVALFLAGVIYFIGVATDINYTNSIDPTDIDDIDSARGRYESLTGGVWF